MDFKQRRNSTNNREIIKMKRNSIILSAGLDESCWFGGRVPKRSSIYKFAICAIASFSFAASAMCDVIHITEGSSSGYTMTDGNTYVVDNSVSFSNETVGGSGITIADNATVVVFVPADVTLTATGANGSGQIGGGAGIHVPETATLIITGDGVVDAKGGIAGNGGNGENGRDGSGGSSTTYGIGGAGGAGGVGGGGAGAAIGGVGGRGGISGVGAQGTAESRENGSDGENGGNGEESGAMGSVFILGRLLAQVQGGENSTNGVAGASGVRKTYDKVSPWKGFAGGGGGGGGGGAGAAPKCPIGSGGQSGGGGGGGGGGGVRVLQANASNNYKPNSNTRGGGGLGGKSEVASGEAGDSKLENGGAGGSGGLVGAEGGAGNLYISLTAIVDVDRVMLSAETHAAAQYGIVFDANGGVLSSETDTATATLGCALPDCISAPVRKGCVFGGWKDEVGTEYYGGDGAKTLSTYSVPSGVVLHAEWIEDPQGMVISPTDGTTFEDSLVISMSSSVADATIYFTLDGSDPTTDSSVYQKKFRINREMVVKAIAVGEGWASNVAIAHYALGQCPDPVIVSAGGETFQHNGNQVSIEWECADGVLRYTTDGSDVTETSPEYVVAFAIDDTTTIKAKAFGETYFDSKQVELTVTREWESVATPLIAAAESFSGGKTMVSISCATEGATIRYTVDGSEPNSHSTRYSGAFEVRESTVVKAFAMLADYANSEVATKTITKVWGIGDSVGLPDHAFTTDGDAGWVNDGGAAMRSGKITHKQASVLRSTFVGKGRLTFELKTSCEEDLPEYMEYDRAEIWMNGVLKMKQDGVHDWMPFEFDLDGASTTVEWRYVKDDVDDAKYPGEDCIWVRNIVWMPELTCTTEVPVEFSWIRERFGDLGNYYYDYEEKVKETAANGHKVWECYVAGEDPMDRESRFTATIKMGVDGKPIVSWKPPLNGEAADGAGIREGVRSYSVYGKQSLGDAAEEWTPVAEGDEGNYQFFKVGVGMPEKK